MAELPRIRSPEAAAPDEEADLLAQPAPLALLPFKRGAVDEGCVAFLDIVNSKMTKTTAITRMKLLILTTMRWISKKMMATMLDYLFWLNRLLI